MPAVATAVIVGAAVVAATPAATGPVVVTVVMVPVVVSVPMVVTSVAPAVGARGFRAARIVDVLGLVAGPRDVDAAGDGDRR